MKMLHGHVYDVDALTVLIASTPMCRWATAKTGPGPCDCTIPATWLTFDGVNYAWMHTCQAHKDAYAEHVRNRALDGSPYAEWREPIRLPHADAIERLMARLKTLTELAGPSPAERVHAAMVAAFDAKVQTAGLSLDYGPAEMPLAKARRFMGPMTDGRLQCIPCASIEEVDRVADALVTDLVTWLARVSDEGLGFVAVGPPRVAVISAYGMACFGWTLPARREGEI